MNNKGNKSHRSRKSFYQTPEFNNDLLKALVKARSKKDCLFCTDPKNKRKLTVNLLMKKALYTKYASS